MLCSNAFQISYYAPDFTYYAPTLHIIIITQKTIIVTFMFLCCLSLKEEKMPSLLQLKMAALVLATLLATEDQIGKDSCTNFFSPKTKHPIIMPALCSMFQHTYFMFKIMPAYCAKPYIRLLYYNLSGCGKMLLTRMTA